MSEDPTRVLTETILELLGINPPCDASGGRSGYANPQRCPQLMLIEPAGTRVVLERGEENCDVILPESKDPQVTAHWIVQCLAGKVPVPQSIKLQMACCLLAAGEVASVEAGLQRVAQSFK
ncbi:glycosyltransferase family protein [Enterobacter hormaechei subsp. xiangfangensis]|nr:glycosyltransferase family protein [Enterobacter hormaechei subsp. xiangfangensis]